MDREEAYDHYAYDNLQELEAEREYYQDVERDRAEAEYEVRGKDPGENV